MLPLFFFRPTCCCCPPHCAGPEEHGIRPRVVHSQPRRRHTRLVSDPIPTDLDPDHSRQIVRQKSSLNAAFGQRKSVGGSRLDYTAHAPRLILFCSKCASPASSCSCPPGFGRACSRPDDAMQHGGAWRDPDRPREGTVVDGDYSTWHCFSSHCLCLGAGTWRRVGFS